MSDPLMLPFLAAASTEEALWAGGGPMVEAVCIIRLTMDVA